MITSTELPAADARRLAHALAIQREIAPALHALVEVLGKALTASIVGRDLKTVGRWLRGDAPRRDDEKRRVWDTLQIVEVLKESGPSATCAWFVGMNPYLEDRSPADLLAEDARVREVMAAARLFAADCEASTTSRSSSRRSL